MATQRFGHVSIISRPKKIKPVSSEQEIVNMDTLSSTEQHTTPSQSVSHQPVLSKAVEVVKDQKQMARPPFSSFTSDNLKAFSDSDFIIYHPRIVASRTPKIESSDVKKPKASKLLAVAIGIGIIIALAALAGLAMGIYTIVRISQTTTTTNPTITTTITTGLTWSTAGTTVIGTGISGIGPDRISGPWHIAFDSNNYLYVADQGNNRVQKWMVGQGSGTTVAGQVNGASGSLTYYLNQPYGLYVDSSGNIYVADTLNLRVQLWTSSGSSVTTVAGNGVNGSLLTQLSNPSSLAFDSNSSKLYISDTGNHRIMCYASGASTGVIAAGGNGQGTSTTQLSLPTDIYYDSSTHSLVIANTGAHSIVRWAIGSSFWTLVAGVPGSSGSTPFFLYYPFGLTFDSMGNLYVADTTNARVQFFPSGVANGTTIAGVTSTTGNRPNLLNNPRSVLLDAQLNLYVADSNNNRVQMFQRC